jgi:acyl dehydratase
MTERLYLEDLQVGQRFACGQHALDAAQIKAFAREFDPQPFHLDEEAARATFFGGLAASGWHIVCLTMRMIAEKVPFAGGLIGGAAEITWPQPTRPTDVLEVTSIVMEVMPSRLAGTRHGSAAHRKPATRRASCRGSSPPNGSAPARPIEPVLTETAGSATFRPLRLRAGKSTGGRVGPSPSAQA